MPHIDACLRNIESVVGETAGHHRDTYRAVSHALVDHARLSKTESRLLRRWFFSALEPLAFPARPVGEEVVGLLAPVVRVFPGYLETMTVAALWSAWRVVPGPCIETLLGSLVRCVEQLGDRSNAPMQHNELKVVDIQNVFNARQHLLLIRGLHRAVVARLQKRGVNLEPWAPYRWVFPNFLSLALTLRDMGQVALATERVRLPFSNMDLEIRGRTFARLVVAVEAVCCGMPVEEIPLLIRSKGDYGFFEYCQAVVDGTVYGK